MDRYVLPFWGIQDPFSALTHLGAAAASVGATIYLVLATRGSWGKCVSLGIFGSSMMALYTASGLYHLVRVTPVERVFYQRLDHAAIYLLIAGTYTAICGNLLTRGWRWGTLVPIWTIALAGVALKFAYFRIPAPLSTSVYIGMGWLACVAYRPLARVVSHRAMFWVVLGGVLYTAGAILDLFGRPVLVPGVIGAHEIFHVLTVGGSLSFFVFVQRHVLPHDPLATSEAAAV